MTGRPVPGQRGTPLHQFLAGQVQQTLGNWVRAEPLVLAQAAAAVTELVLGLLTFPVAYEDEASAVIGPVLLAGTGHEHCPGRVAYRDATDAVCCGQGHRVYQLAVALVNGCGSHYATEEAASLSKRVLAGTSVAVKCHRCPGWALERAQLPAGNDIPPWVRRRVYSRDKHACVCCGTPTAGRPRSIGHRKRRSQGGPHTFENLLTFLGWGDGRTEDDHHWRIDQRLDPEDEAKGYTLRSYQDPLLVPVMVFSAGGSGVTAWPTADGQWVTEAPAELSAAARLTRRVTCPLARGHTTRPPRRRPLGGTVNTAKRPPPQLLAAPVLMFATIGDLMDHHGMTAAIEAARGAWDDSGPWTPGCLYLRSDDEAGVPDLLAAFGALASDIKTRWWDACNRAAAALEAARSGLDGPVPVFALFPGPWAPQGRIETYTPAAPGVPDASVPAPEGTEDAAGTGPPGEGDQVPVAPDTPERTTP